jgi:hypothetical protein
VECPETLLVTSDVDRPRVHSILRIKQHPHGHGRECGELDGKHSKKRLLDDLIGWQLNRAYFLATLALHLASVLAMDMSAVTNNSATFSLALLLKSVGPVRRLVRYAAELARGGRA